MKRIIFGAVLLLTASFQTIKAQGFRVYKSDGTIAQFSLRTDSIVFYDDIGSDEDFGPFTPVNQCITGTWWKSRTENVTFNEDGTTDFMEGATYEFMPYQGSVIIYNASGAPTSILKVYKITAEEMIVGTSDNLSVWYSSRPVQLVTGIALNKTSLVLRPGESKPITVFIVPSDADNIVVEWESSNEAVAQVSRGYVQAIAKGLCVITCRTTDGSNLKAECKVSVNADTKVYVDLELPSGTLWATCNVGASSPEEFGDYFAWGETEPKNSYTWKTYKWMNEGQASSLQINKYTIADGKTEGCWYSDGVFAGDGMTELLPEDDAATANWGSEWQMPSYEQINELLNPIYTSIAKTTRNGVTGRLITSRDNGKSIFLPDAGNKEGTTYFNPSTNENARTFYMSRELSGQTSEASNVISIDWAECTTRRLYRHYGISVRPVIKR